jgi:hypothetical protein
MCHTPACTAELLSIAPTSARSNAEKRCPAIRSARGEPHSAALPQGGKRAGTCAAGTSPPWRCHFVVHAARRLQRLAARNENRCAFSTRRRHSRRVTRALQRATSPRARIADGGCLTWQDHAGAQRELRLLQRGPRSRSDPRARQELVAEAPGAAARRADSGAGPILRCARRPVSAGLLAEAAGVAAGAVRPAAAGWSEDPAPAAGCLR